MTWLNVTQVKCIYAAVLPTRENRALVGDCLRLCAHAEVVTRCVYAVFAASLLQLEKIYAKHGGGIATLVAGLWIRMMSPLSSEYSFTCEGFHRHGVVFVVFVMEQRVVERAVRVFDLNGEHEAPREEEGASAFVSGFTAVQMTDVPSRPRP